MEVNHADINVRKMSIEVDEKCSELTLSKTVSISVSSQKTAES